ncbi:hypothetical protein Syun_000355 [Stephania yunnanensis]|uniref:Uncharacterized protein n=1 Tax=Stephania yunnanensis TaxID=152371 RepID=A0AAP0LCY4_9MAGN
MNTLKAFQIFPPNKHGFCHKRELPSRKICFLSHGNNLNETPAESSPEGDAQKQELLAKIAMLQAQKVRLTDYLDERSAYLTQFAEEANAEFDEIRETALKGLDESGTRIMENLESQMQAFEESQESNRAEIEKNEKKLLDFEAQMDNDRNEGLFFKNLRQKAPTEKQISKEEAKKITKITRENAGSNVRKNIYIVLMGLLAVIIADALIYSPDWKKVAVLGAIFVALFSQFAYEQSVSSETEKKDE